MENKKGLSDVVTTVLIVLLTIVAIAILWGFLQPMFTKSGAKVQQAEACLSMNLEVVRCTFNATNTLVTVRRGAGAANLKEVKLVLESSVDGSTNVITSTTVPTELGSVIYPAPKLGYNKSAVVAAGLADEQGDVNYCTPTQPVTCR